jgi:hypothetical protein
MRKTGAMTTTRKLPPGFAWRHELDQDTLYCDGIPVARVEPFARGLMVRTLVRSSDLSPQETMVASVERGMALASRWVNDRQAPVRHACVEVRRNRAANADQSPESPSIARWFQT